MKQGGNKLAILARIPDLFKLTLGRFNINRNWDILFGKLLLDVCRLLPIWGKRY